MAKISFILASTPDGVIGDGGRLPWHLPEDLALFKQKTLYEHVLMGRKTYESLPESFKPLPNRKSFIATRDRNLHLGGAKMVYDPVRFALSHPHPLWVIGGAELFHLLKPFCSEVHLTHIYTQAQGDTRYVFDPTGWDVVSDSGELTSRTQLRYRVWHYRIPLEVAQLPALQAGVSCELV